MPKTHSPESRLSDPTSTPVFKLCIIGIAPYYRPVKKTNCRIVAAQLATTLLTEITHQDVH